MAGLLRVQAQPNLACWQPRLRLAHHIARRAGLPQLIHLMVGEHVFGLQIKVVDTFEALSQAGRDLRHLEVRIFRFAWHFLYRLYSLTNQSERILGHIFVSQLWIA